MKEWRHDGVRQYSGDDRYLRVFTIKYFYSLATSVQKSFRRCEIDLAQVL